MKTNREKRKDVFKESEFSCEISKPAEVINIEDFITDIEQQPII